MADPIDCMVTLAECQAAAAIDPRFAQYVAEADRKIDSALARYGFRDLNKTREAMKLPVARIVQAKKIALEQLAQLARDEGPVVGSG